MIGWYRDGADVERRLPLLSTWLGHTEPKHTYWYLSAVPELLELIADHWYLSAVPELLELIADRIDAVAEAGQ